MIMDRNAILFIQFLINEQVFNDYSLRQKWYS